METSVIAASTKAFDVVAVGKPVGAAEIALGCHVVAVLIDVDKLTYLGVDALVGRL